MEFDFVKIRYGDDDSDRPIDHDFDNPAVYFLLPVTMIIVFISTLFIFVFVLF